MDATPEDFPATSPPLPDDYSDVASEQSEDDAAAERQKYQRGGRKKNTTKVSKSRMPPIPDSQIAPEPEHREEQELLQEETKVNGTTTCAECAARKQKPAPKVQRPPFETGIRAFNLKKAAGSGGRPVGLRATTAESKKAKKKSAKKKKKPQPEVKESETEEETTTEEEQEEEEKQEESKPVKIKLDLDLMIEIFLKAKIQGEVTITFLE